MPRITLVRSANAVAVDAQTGTRVAVGRSVDVPSDVADRLASTASLGDEWRVEQDAAPPDDVSSVWENASAQADQPSESARDAQEVNPA